MPKIRWGQNRVHFKLLWIFGALFVFFSTALANASTEDEQFPIPNTPQAGHHSVLMMNSADWYSTFSKLEMFKSTGPVLCSSLDDPTCATAQTGHYDAILPICNSDLQTDCIESLDATLANGTKIHGSFTEYIYGLKHPNKFTGDGDQIPASPADPSIWKLTGAEHAFGSEYALTVGVSGSVDRAVQGRMLNDFYINLYAISRYPTGNVVPNSMGFANFPFCQQKQNDSTRADVGCGGGGQDLGNYRCPLEMLQGGICLLSHKIPSDIRFQVKVRLKFEPNGMFHGRLNSPSISIEKTSNGSLISIEAQSVRVPELYFGDYWQNLSSELQSYWTNCLADQSCRWGSRNPLNPMNDPLNRNLFELPTSYGDHAMKLISMYAPYVKDTAVSAPTVWNIHLLGADQMGDANQCFKTSNGFLGLVTTNSTAYSAGPPAFENGTLNYRVASLHFLPNGDIFHGTYGLVLRSDVARCIYNFSKAPISATITVLSTDGSNQVASTSVNEKNNFLYLFADNFTFSSPTVLVKLQQESVKVATTPGVVTKIENFSNSAQSSKQNIKSITCIKGKKKLSVKSINPKCPKGYRT